MRKVLNAHAYGSMLIALAIVAPACMTGTGESKAEGSIQAALTVGASRHDVTAIHYKVVDINSSCEAAPLAETTSPLESEDLPSGVLPAGSGAHAGADGLFVLPPGQYRICATPLGAEGPSAACASTEGTATVVPDAATEIVLVSQCGDGDNGGVDAVTALNDPPKIGSLSIAPSKFIIACETATITAGAADPDGDQFSYSWTVTQSPAGAEARLQAADGVATFAADSAGDYQVKVAVTDIHGGTSSLSFPIHVSALSCAPQDQCHTAGACDLNTGACSNPAAADGTACDDGNGNTTADQCTAGVCAGTTSSCACPAGFTTLSDGGCQKSYDIDANHLINQAFFCDSTGENRYDGCSGQPYGFQWSDEGGSLGSVTDLSVQFDSGVSCVSGSRTAALNGLAIGTFNVGGECSCVQSHIPASFANAAASSYVLGGVNSILVNPQSCEGVSASSAIGGAYARITVTYALPSSCGGNPPNTCSHDLCSTGGVLTASCDSCAAQICSVDPYCCNTFWDGICTGEVTSVCGRSCP